ncbi:MAG: AAA family ATPase [Dehalococcoidia bacterium]
MLRSIEIENFRRLRSLRIDDLGQINLIVGANNAGKTSLLEAIWLLRGEGDPFSLRRAATFRNADNAPDALWPGLFGDMQVAKTIQIRGTRERGDQESLEIATAPDAATNGGAEARFPIPAQLLEAPAPAALQFVYQEPGGRPVMRWWQRGEPPDGPAPLTLKDSPPGPSTFLSARLAVSAPELATAFTLVLDQPGGEEILQAMQALEPRLTQLSLGFVNQTPIIRAHIGFGRPIPLQLLGEGAVRLMEILLALPLVRRGTLFVDEIENGFYYQSLPRVWRAVATASQLADVQVFATTHSLECVDAAVQALGEDSDRFRLHRLEATEDGGVRTVTYGAQAAKAAAEMELEVR